MKCKECPYLVKKENISLVSRMMGYTAECARLGVLFNLEDISKTPPWCPLVEEELEKI